AIEQLAGERLLMDHAATVAVEEAAISVLQLDDAHGSLVDQDPGQLLVVDEAAAFYRIGEVHLEGVARVEDGVVATLDHAGAAALGDEALDDDGDINIWVGVEGVEGGH